MKKIIFSESKKEIYQFFQFISVGFLNTTLNFLVLNLLSKLLNVNQGLSLGFVASAAFLASVIQSYFWNKTWTFGRQATVSTKKDIVRMTVIGLLGILTLLILLAASRMQAPWTFYFFLTFIFLVLQLIIWRQFDFHLASAHSSHSFFGFLFVTLLGLGINFLIIAVISNHWHLTGTDLDKNIAAIIASFASLIWNFTGYKLVIFK